MKGIAAFCALVVAICASAQTITWEKVSPNTTWWPISDVASGNGAVVAVAAYEVIASRDDGLTWKVVLASSTSKQFISLAFGNGIFLLTAQGTYYTSSDGLIWAAHPGGDGGPVMFGNGLFVAGGASGYVSSTPDGISWTGTQVPGAANLYQGAAGNGIFIFKEPYSPSPVFPQIEYPKFVTKSEDGTNWTHLAMNLPRGGCAPGSICNGDQNFSGLTFANGKFVAHSGGMLGPLGYISSEDGVNWTILANEAGTGGGGLYYGGGRFIELRWYDSSRRTPAQVWSSPDLINWKSQDIPYLPDRSMGPTAVTYTGSKYVVVGDSGMVMRGETPDALERVDSLDKEVDVTGVAAVSNIVVAVAGIQMNSIPAISVSTNGGRTFERRMEFPPKLASIAYGDGKFVAVGDGLATVTSPNGLDWTQNPGNGVVGLYDVKYANGLWVAVGGNGVIVTSTDATFFNGRVSGSHEPLNGVAYGAGVWVAVGINGTVITSTDGVNWNAGTVGSTVNLGGVAFGNGVFVVVGAGGAVYTSANGADWTPGSIAGIASTPQIAFAHGVFVTGDVGTRNTYVSVDGKTWTKSELPEGMGVGAVNASNGRIWVSAGHSLIYRDELPAIVVSGEVNGAKQFTLSFNAPADGVYKVYAATDAGALNWDAVTTLTVSAGKVSWTDEIPFQSARFYYVRQE